MVTLSQAPKAERFGAENMQGAILEAASRSARFAFAHSRGKRSKLVNK